MSFRDEVRLTAPYLHWVLDLDFCSGTGSGTTQHCSEELKE